MPIAEQTRRTFLNILGSDGSIRQSVAENTPGAVRRDYELKDGTKGTKFEKVYARLWGPLQSIEIFEGDFGKNLLVTIDGYTLSMSVQQPFAEDFMKKLPNIDPAKEIELKPYSFEDEKGKLRRGVTITQDGVKIQNHYYDPEKKEVANGYPEVGDSTGFDSDDWKMYFMKARKFLLAETEKHPLFKVFMPNDTPIPTAGDVKYPEAEVAVEDIPF